MKCPYCGREVIYSDRFCKCGAELDMVVCPHCGTPNITLATFCGNCGTILLGAEPYVPEPEEVEAEEPEETAIPEEEPEEAAIPEEEPEEAAIPEEEPEEAVIPEEEPEEAAIPEEEPEEAAIPEEESVEPGMPDQEPEEPVILEEPEPETPVEPVVPEEELTEPLAAEEEPTESLAAEEELTEPLAAEEEPTESLAAEDEPTEPLVSEEGPGEAFAAEEETEEPVIPPEETEEAAMPEDGGGGKKRRRGGLIALWIVIAIIVVVVIVLLVWATRGNREESTPVENEENLSQAEREAEEKEKEEKEEDEEPMLPATVSDVSFDRKTTADNQEYAVVTAKDEDGNVVWEYTTPEYAMAELDRTSDIGLHGDSYFLIQDGAVLSLDKETGDTLWENGDYGGSPVDHSWAYGSDGLYLCGYDGPAIYGVSYDGDTLGKIDAFDDLTEVTETNLWPYKVLVSGNEATVYYGPENVLEEGDKAVTENEATVYSVNLNTWEYTLISNGAAKVESTSGNNGSGSNGGSGSDNGGSGSNDGSGDSGSGSGSGSNGGSGGDSGSGSNGGSGSGSGGSGGSDSGSGSGSGGSGGSGSGSGSGGGSSAPKVSMSDVKDVTASSYLYESNVNISHDPKYLVDGTLKNAWCEDASGDGIGQWAKVEFNGTYTVSGMNINAGYQKSESLYYENCRPKEITITFSDGSSFNTTLEDVDKEQNVSFSKPVNTSSVTITIRSVYKGSKYEDTCISEVAFY